MTKKKWIIIDGNSLINRTFYALPPLTNTKGIHTNALYGFASILMKVIDEEKPDYVGVAFDEKKTLKSIRQEGLKCQKNLHSNLIY